MSCRTLDSICLAAHAQFMGSYRQPRKEIMKLINTPTRMSLQDMHGQSAAQLAARMPNVAAHGLHARSGGAKLSDACTKCSHVQALLTSRAPQNLNKAVSWRVRARSQGWKRRWCPSQAACMQGTASNGVLAKQGVGELGARVAGGRLLVCLASARAHGRLLVEAARRQAREQPRGAPRVCAQHPQKPDKRPAQQGNCFPAAMTMSALQCCFAERCVCHAPQAGNLIECNIRLCAHVTEKTPK